MLRSPRILLVLSAAAILGLSNTVSAQPTYKLGVKPDLKPLATLKLDGNKLIRTEVADDPGFRIQYHFKKDGKTASQVEARSSDTMEVPQKEAGTYTVVLELFYPAYKGGTATKGEFKPISNVLTFKLEPGAKPEDPVKLTLLDDSASKTAPDPSKITTKPVLVIQCGKGDGKQQDELVTAGYGYKLIQGTSLSNWPQTAAKTHCWQDPKELTFEVTLPAGTPGTLRLFFVDGDEQKRRAIFTVQGKEVGRVSMVGRQGQLVDVPIATGDTKDGKIAVVLKNLNPTGSAVVSTIEFYPAAAEKK
jgi:hypothetical protein